MWRAVYCVSFFSLTRMLLKYINWQTRSNMKYTLTVLNDSGFSEKILNNSRRTIIIITKNNRLVDSHFVKFLFLSPVRFRAPLTISLWNTISYRHLKCLMPKLSYITNWRKTSVRRNLFPQALCDTKITHFYEMGPAFNQKESLTIVELRDLELALIFLK